MGKISVDDDLISNAFLEFYKCGVCDALDVLLECESIDRLDTRNQELLHNRDRRVKRVKKRCSELIFSGSALFLTLTFSNDTLDRTSVETRRKYIQRFLKSQTSFYIANIDFGDKNGREHYHAIVDKRISPNLWAYGLINIEHIKISRKSLKSVSKYITKLSSHAIKKSTGHAYRIMYSKG